MMNEEVSEKAVRFAMRIESASAHSLEKTLEKAYRLYKDHKAVPKTVHGKSLCRDGKAQILWKRMHKGGETIKENCGYSKGGDS